ncbi:Pentatricopeptide repeat-containing protein, chloroplastic [Symbiodinium microadriaticum]|uniref:Pentatricopeptide repeat-containing protein, chloroplastic n=1 Tax=Symbiodinium microadriaticum TaxID=2951 RepID=A0A1Q9CPW3_SYMMI|nr:Pentatricopeptide repeat-containing protein, chloroplastic [Symbiodinium microadriaticum]
MSAFAASRAEAGSRGICIVSDNRVCREEGHGMAYIVDCPSTSSCSPGQRKLRTTKVEDLLERLGRHPSSEQVLRVLEPVLPSWVENPKKATVVLSALANKKLPAAATQVLAAMLSQQAEVNSFHISSVISAAGRCGDWALAMSLLQRPELAAQPTEIAWNAAITACETGGEWQRAVLLLSQMQLARVSPGIVSFNATLSACKKGSDWQLALGLLRRMAAERLQPDMVTFGAAIAACGSSWQSAIDLVSQMLAAKLHQESAHVWDSRAKPGYNAAISACERSGQWQSAIGLLFEMGSSWLVPDLVSFNAAILSCREEGQWQLAVHLLNALSAVGLFPETSTFNALLAACGARWTMALACLHEMQARAAVPDTISFTAAIAACEKGSEWLAAMKLFCEMEGVAEPSVVSYNALINTCDVKWQVAIDFFERMLSQEIQPDVITYNALIGAFARGSERALAFSLLTTMRSEQVSPDDVTFIPPALACQQAGAWQDVMAILPLMLRHRLVPDAVYAGCATSTLRACKGEDYAFAFLRNLRSLWEPDGESRISDGPEVLRKGPGIVAVLKPAHVTTQDFVESLRQRAPVGTALSIVSRLDYPTSGVLPLVVGAEGSLQTNWFRSQFAAGLVRKEYYCLCEGPSLGEVGVRGEVDMPLLTSEVEGGEGGLVSRSEVSEYGRQAFTEYEVRRRFRFPELQQAPEDEVMFLSVRPRTGRTHQIRVHMASLGRPLVGDFTYGKRSETSVPFCPRLFLHCHSIQLVDVEGAPFLSKADITEDLQAVLQNLHRWAID